MFDSVHVRTIRSPENEYVMNWSVVSSKTSTEKFVTYENPATPPLAIMFTSATGCVKFKVADGRLSKDSTLHHASLLPVTRCCTGSSLVSEEAEMELSGSKDMFIETL